MKTDTTKATIASIYLQETEIYFFSGLVYWSHVSGINSHWKRIFSKIKVFEYDDVIRHTAHALYDTQSYLHRLSVFVWSGENDSNTLRVNTFFFQNGGKNLSFQK